MRTNFNASNIPSFQANDVAITKFLILFAEISLLIFCLPLQGKSQNNNYYGWQFESQREGISPVWRTDNEITFDMMPTLVLAGGGKAYADGHWFKTIEVNSGEFYQFQVYFMADNVDEPARSVLGRILWQDANGEQVEQAEYPATLTGKSPQGWSVIQQVYKVPENATRAKVELVYRWDPDGTVYFGGFSLVPTDDPGSRVIRVATISHRPVNSKVPQDNLDQFAGLIAKAAEKKTDIVCLPEGITLVGTDLNYLSASEPVPGPTTAFLGEIARKNHLYIVAGIYELDGEVVYNTSVLIGRNGELVGKYHKVSLPREEIEGGITPGDELPVFDTDLGKIGMMICWDVSFPEVARTLARKGAEIILMPIWGGNITLARARAIENQVYLVSSSYDMESAIFDQEGTIIAEATDADPVVVAEIDLNKQKLWPWLGDFKSRIPREIPSHKAINEK
jgi:predicted amidohydrolase